MEFVMCAPNIQCSWTVWSSYNTFLTQFREPVWGRFHIPATVMPVNRTLYLFSRLQRHLSTRTARSCREVSGSRLLLQQPLPCSAVCRRNVSSNSSPPKAPDTSLFVPVSLKTDIPADGAVGAELTQPLDKSEPEFILCLGQIFEEDVDWKYT